jgi:hypothetical protein
MSKDDLVAAAQKCGEHFDTCPICQKSDVSLCDKGMYLLQKFYTELQVLFNKGSPKKGD